MNCIIKHRVSSFSICSILVLLALGAAGAGAAPISRLNVRIVLGAEELAAGSDVELRIYEIGGRVRRLPLCHGESWPRDSTRLIALKLSDALDPRTVVRFAVYYRASSPQAPPWEIVAADVEFQQGQEPAQRLLDTTLSGVIDRQGELASVERDKAALICRSDADCDDGRSCNGRERCAPSAASADARGCVKGAPIVCPVNQVCVEGSGCRGAELLKKILPVPAGSPQSQ
jgi:hypothetical protein